MKWWNFVLPNFALLLYLFIKVYCDVSRSCRAVNYRQRLNRQETSIINIEGNQSVCFSLSVKYCIRNQGKQDHPKNISDWCEMLLGEVFRPGNRLYVNDKLSRACSRHRNHLSTKILSHIPLLTLILLFGIFHWVSLDFMHRNSLISTQQKLRTRSKHYRSRERIKFKKKVNKGQKASPAYSRGVTWSSFIHILKAPFIYYKSICPF